MSTPFYLTETGPGAKICRLAIKITDWNHKQFSKEKSGGENAGKSGY